MKKRLLIVGGHGSGEIAMSVFEDINSVKDEWNIEGYLTDIKNPGEYLGRHKVLGGTDEIEEYVKEGYYIHNALYYSAKSKFDRVERFRNLDIPLEANASAIHPTAYVSSSTEIGYGVLICSNAATSAGPKIGNFVHIYTNGFVGHDTTVMDYCTIAAHSVVGARILLNEGAHVGLNSCLREDLIIGKYSIIGMGSVVVKNVDNFSIVAGNPAKLLNRLR